MAAYASKSAKKRVLVVNVYLPETREPVRLTREVPNTLAPVFLAGAFAPDTCDIRIWNEVSSGFLELFEPSLIQWPDMVVFTGLVASFDRMKHLAAYLRTANPNVVLVAGGQGIRAFRRYARPFFDYVCVGDAAGAPAGVRADTPGGSDPADWRGGTDSAEASRNCNFRCSFCSLPGEGGRYQK